MKRRGFIKSILIAAAAPAIIPIERIMPVKTIIPVKEFDSPTDMAFMTMAFDHYINDIPSMYIDLDQKEIVHAIEWRKKNKSGWLI